MKSEVKKLLQDEYFIKWVIDPDELREAFWEAWLRDNSHKNAAVKEAKTYIHSQFNFRYSPMKESSKTRGWMKVQEAIVNDMDSTKQESSIFDTFFKRAAWIKYAAVLLLCASVIFAYYLWLHLRAEPDINNIAFIEKIIPLGSKLTVRLEDGSVVQLNSGTTLHYPKKFNVKREVFIDGEGYFEVKSDTMRPFVVHSGDIATTVLGTSFNIENYSDSEETKICVVSGKVSVRNSSRKMMAPYYLEATDQLTFHKSSGSVKTSEFDIEQVIDWKDGIIHFNEADFEEIKNRLERWYGVKLIVNEEPIVEQDFNGRFQDKSLETVLKGLSFSLNFKYKIKGETVIIN